MRKPVQPSNGGNPEGAVYRGRLFLGYFLFGEAKESNLLSGSVVVGALAPYNHGVLLAGATPDGFAFKMRGNTTSLPPP